MCWGAGGEKRLTVPGGSWIQKDSAVLWTLVAQRSEGPAGPEDSELGCPPLSAGTDRDQIREPPPDTLAALVPATFFHV